MTTLRKAALAAAAVCYPALASAIPPPSLPAGATSEASAASPSEAKVEARDPRHAGIRVEVPVGEAAGGGDPERLYRSLVRTRRVSADMVVVENGRVFFRNAASVALARAEPPASEPVPAAPLALEVEEAPPAPQPQSLPSREAAAPAKRRAMPRPAAQPALEIPDDVIFALRYMASDDEAAPLPSGLAACPALERLGFAGVPRPPVPEPEFSEDLVFCTHARARPGEAPVILVESYGAVSLVSLAEAGEWLVLRAPR